jgi:hypothetical protein
MSNRDRLQQAISTRGPGLAFWLITIAMAVLIVVAAVQA